MIDKHRLERVLANLEKEGLEQMIIMGQGCRALSARSLKEEVQIAVKELRSELETHNPKEKHTIGDALSQDMLKKLYDSTEE